MDSIPAFLKHKAPEIDPAWSNVALASAITKNAAIHSEPPRAASTESVVSGKVGPRFFADIWSQSQDSHHSIQGLHTGLHSQVD